MYDLIIIGASAAGVAASVYAARRNLNFVLVSGDVGGEVATSGTIDNYPGIVHTDGIALSREFAKQLAANGVKPETPVLVESIERGADGTFVVRGRRVTEPALYRGRTVLVATGVRPRHLEVPGEKELRGKGVTYCTVCDGPLFRGKIVATVGGGNSALESALMLAGIAERVFVINKNSQFKGEQVLIDKVTSTPNVTIIYNAQTERIAGTQVVEGLVYRDVKSGQEQSITIAGVFIHIGMLPNSVFVPADVERNTFGEVVADQFGRTSVSGIWAAGDVTTTPHKQIAIATGQGVTALLNIVEHLNRLKH